MEKRLLRSRTEKWIGGICGGLGKFFGIDPTIWRLIFIFGTLFGMGSFVLIYIIMWITVPREPINEPVIVTPNENTTKAE